MIVHFQCLLFGIRIQSYTILIILVITGEAKYKHNIMYGEIWAMLPYYTVSISHALTSLLCLLCQVGLGSPIKMSQLSLVKTGWWQLESVLSAVVSVLLTVK